jgi:hypothetical protein
LSSWRRPLRFVYGNCLQGSCGPWALFALEPYSYATLATARKRERFGRLLAALESMDADVQIIRVARAWTPAADFDPLARGYSGPHPAAHGAYLSAQLAALDCERADLPAVFLAVSLERPQRDVGAFVAEFGERPPRELVRSAVRYFGVTPCASSPRPS